MLHPAATLESASSLQELPTRKSPLVTAEEHMHFYRPLMSGYYRSGSRQWELLYLAHSVSSRMWHTVDISLCVDQLLGCG